MLVKIEQRMLRVERKLGNLFAPNPPQGFCSLEKALPRTGFPGVDELRKACDRGAFAYGSELLIIGPRHAAEPCYRLNVSAIQQRQPETALAA